MVLSNFQEQRASAWSDRMAKLSRDRHWRLVFAFEKTRQVDEPMSAHCYCVKTEALIKSEPSL